MCFAMANVQLAMRYMLAEMYAGVMSSVGFSCMILIKITVERKFFLTFFTYYVVWIYFQRSSMMREGRKDRSK